MSKDGGGFSPSLRRQREQATRVIFTVRSVTGFVVGFMLLFGAVGWVGAENPSEPVLAPLWTEARLGDHDAQYRLGRHYESRYWLAERDPDGPAGDPIDVVLAYGLFRMAEDSAHWTRCMAGTVPNTV